ncbi:MAG: ABC transporter permease subunit [Chloroflexota bacterium]
MAQITAKPPPQPDEGQGIVSRILSYVFDVRFLGVLGQIAFILVLVFGATTIFENFGANVNRLGDAQFRCRDGRTAYRCAYDFMDNEAGFDISDAPLTYTNTDSFWWALINGVVNTFRVGFLALIATTFLGTAIGISRLSTNWLVSRLALAYIEIIRNTPILIQLLLIYFSVILALPDIREAVQPLGLPIYLSNRGLSMPWPQFMSSASTWVAFIILGVIQFQVTWIYLGRREEQTGRETNRLTWGLVGFFLIAGAGWFIASSTADNEGLLIPKSSRIEEIRDFEKVMLARAEINYLEELGALPEEELSAVTLQVCALRESSSEANFTNKIAGLGIPFEVSRSGTPAKATENYVDGDCEMFAAPKSILAAELATLENPSSHVIVPVSENPIVFSIPKFEGFNVIGGFAMTGEFFALFLGLTIFYSGGLAEVVRAGILSVSKGQTEAARALGLNEGQRLNLIVLPQALRVIIPPLISTYLSLMKDTSLGIAVAFPEIYGLSQVLINQSGRALQIIIIIMVVYLSISLFFSAVLNWYNSRIVLVER